MPDSQAQRDTSPERRAALAERVASSAQALLRSAHDAGFQGRDPYDALWWPHWPRVMVAGPRRRTIIAQLHVRAPVDLRAVYRRDNPLIPKALGVFASAALRLSEGGTGEAQRQGTRALELLDSSCSGSTAGWAYPFDVQTRWSFYEAGSPNVVATVYAARPLAEAADRWRRPEWAARADAAVRWVLDALLQPDGYFAYHPTSTVLVHNANLLGAQIVHERLGEDAVVRRAVALTLDEQHADGSWHYGQGARLGFVDSFHTAFVLECLCLMRDLDPAISDAVRRGADFWVKRFFLPDGTALLWPNRRWPEDAHATGTALTTLSLLVRSGFVDRELLVRTARYALDRMLDGDRAIPRRYRVGRSTLRYIRWSDAHMALGLANAAATLDDS